MGRLTKLYMVAQRKLSLILSNTTLARSRVATTPFKSPSRINTTSALSMAMLVPPPTPMPTLALVRATASLMPSPTKTTCSPSRWRFATTSPFSSGMTPVKTLWLLMPHSLATRAAASLSSPVQMYTWTPLAWRSATTAGTPGLTSSWTLKQPITEPSSSTAAMHLPWKLSQLALPTRTALPPMLHETPCPGKTLKSSQVGRGGA
mmetsp:Transcript_2906/g.6118  ORF Transcript_2906/g.6118 Transcript_2906/m.6118 type:complete len:205 (+) Transcript_2906:320-934(+)